MSLVASLFVMGFAGNAAADRHHRDGGDTNVQYSEQHAWSGVNQDQYVAQGNANHQDDNYAVSASAAWKGGEAGSGDAYAVQYSDQENKNAQAAWSNAQNFNEQEQED
ncbi:hypothetical protein [Haladaptatus sp. CMAA 1911]|uniref:hypothetical protein n=1 Tax=unclassified Haladaptatus TaxID=2622732 RepID=UPI003754B150